MENVSTCLIHVIDYIFILSEILCHISNIFFVYKLWYRNRFKYKICLKEILKTSRLCDIESHFLTCILIPIHIYAISEHLRLFHFIAFKRNYSMLRLNICENPQVRFIVKTEVRTCNFRHYYYYGSFIFLFFVSRTVRHNMVVKQIYFFVGKYE